MLLPGACPWRFLRLPRTYGWEPDSHVVHIHGFLVIEELSPDQEADHKRGHTEHRGTSFHSTMVGMQCFSYAPRAGCPALPASPRWKGRGTVLIRTSPTCVSSSISRLSQSLQGPSWGSSEHLSCFHPHPPGMELRLWDSCLHHCCESEVREQHQVLVFNRNTFE